MSKNLTPSQNSTTPINHWLRFLKKSTVAKSAFSVLALLLVLFGATFTINQINRDQEDASAGNITSNGNTLTIRDTDIDPIKKTIFSYTGASQSYTVPTGATDLRVKAWGAGGGSVTFPGTDGGAGGFASSTIEVSPTQNANLNVVVGGAGTFINELDIIIPGGYGGGGNGGLVTIDRSPGSSGGGLTGLFTSSVDFSDQASLNTTQANSLMVVGAGGGSSWSGNGGAGGSTTGGNSNDSNFALCLTPGSLSTGGTATNGGSGSVLSNNDESSFDGTNGAALKGGNGGNGTRKGAGGGGGAGYFGGGGGHGGSDGSCEGSSGAGGSSFIPSNYTFSGFTGSITTIQSLQGNGRTAPNTSDPDYTGQIGTGANGSTFGTGGNGLLVIEGISVVAGGQNCEVTSVDYDTQTNETIVVCELPEASILSITQATVTNPDGTTKTTDAFSTITGTLGEAFPNIPLVANSLSNGTVANFVPVGSSTLITGTIQNGNFIPNSGSVIPNDATTGAATGVLSSDGTSDVDVYTNFSEPAPILTEGTGTVTGTVGQPVAPITGLGGDYEGAATLTIPGGQDITGSISSGIFTPNDNQLINSDTTVGSGNSTLTPSNTNVPAIQLPTTISPAPSSSSSSTSSSSSEESSTSSESSSSSSESIGSISSQSSSDSSVVSSSSSVSSEQSSTSSDTSSSISSQSSNTSSVDSSSSSSTPNNSEGCTSTNPCTIFEENLSFTPTLKDRKVFGQGIGGDSSKADLKLKVSGDSRLDGAVCNFRYKFYGTKTTPANSVYSVLSPSNIPYQPATGCEVTIPKNNQSDYIVYFEIKAQKDQKYYQTNYAYVFSVGAASIVTITGEAVVN